MTLTLTFCQPLLIDRNRTHAMVDWVCRHHIHWPQYKALYKMKIPIYVTQNTRYILNRPQCDTSHRHRNHSRFVRRVVTPFDISIATPTNVCSIRFLVFFR